MQRVADWLEKLGLGQYAQRFAENDISFSVLPDLTDQDLKDIGVSLGHRRHLLREIANLNKTATASPPTTSLTAFPIAARPVVPSWNLHREYSVSLMKSTACAPSPTRMATKR
jgi:hypothetical protein